MMDFIGELRRMQSAANAETFDRTTDSLEALRDFLVGGSASGGLAYYGVVTNIVGATQFDAALLAGHNDSFFNNFVIYVVRDSLGGGILPQGTGRLCTAYVSATGRFTSVAFIPALTVGDEILLVNRLLTQRIVASGVITGDSVIQPADALRGEADQWFRGCTLQMLTGPCAGQTRAIVYFQGAGGIFTLDTANPLTALPVAGSAYLVWGGDAPICPLPNATPSLTPGDVIGNKADIASIAATASIVALLRSVMTATIAGKIQSFTYHCVSAANAAGVTFATVGVGACKIKSVVVRANAAQTADLTSIAITCGGAAGTTNTLIDAALGIRANIAALDQQVLWEGTETLPIASFMVITLVGGGATAVNLQIDIEYEAITAGGLLA